MGLKMDQRRVMELVERFRVERGLDTLAQLVALIRGGCTDQETLRKTGIAAMYWFANLVADDQKELCALYLEENGYPDLAVSIRGLT